MSAAYELSVQQRRLWANRSRATRQVAVVSLSEFPEATALKDALARVAEAHDILSTAYVTSPGRRFPLQVPQAAAPPVALLVSGTAEDAETAAADAVRGQHLDPVSGPVLAAAVAQDGHGARLAVSALPLTADGPSLRLAAAEVAGALGGCPPQPGVPYAGYAQWQRDAERAETDATGVFSPGEIAEMTHLPLPYENREPDGPPNLRRLPLPGRWPVDAALAAWVITLTRLTGASRITVAICDSGRGIEDLHGAIGPFERLAPLPLEPSGTAGDFVRSAAVAYDASRRTSSAQPTALADPESWRAGFLVYDDVDTAPDPSVPVTVWLEITRTGAAIGYDAARIPAEVVEGLAGRLRGLLELIAVATDTPVRSCSRSRLPPWPTPSGPRARSLPGHAASTPPHPASCSWPTRRQARLSSPTTRDRSRRELSPR